MSTEIQKTYTALVKSLDLKGTPPKFTLQDGMVPVAVLCSCFSALPQFIAATTNGGVTVVANSAPLSAGTYEISGSIACEVDIAGAVENSYLALMAGGNLIGTLGRWVHGRAVGLMNFDFPPRRVLVSEGTIVSLSLGGVATGINYGRFVIQPV